MNRLENNDIRKADAGVNSKQLVDLSQEKSTKFVDRAGAQAEQVTGNGRVQFSDIYNECCVGVDKSGGPQNRNERSEKPGAATDPKWGSARERLTKSDSQKNEIRERGYREIQYGDTLSDIAKANLEIKNGGKAASGAEIWREVERIAKVNNLDPRKNIRPGTRIYMEKCANQNTEREDHIEPSKGEVPAPATREDGKSVPQDNPPVNFSPDRETSIDAVHEREHHQRERELREKEETFKSKDEDLGRREADLKRQLEELKRLKEEIERMREQNKGCEQKTDDHPIWEH